MKQLVYFQILYYDNIPCLKYIILKKKEYIYSHHNIVLKDILK